MIDGSVLIFGASGFLGPELAAAFAPDKTVCTHCWHGSLGSVYFDVLRTPIDEVFDVTPRPSVAVIALGITDMDACSRDSTGTGEVNVAGVIRLIDALRERDVMPVFVSSESVFDGTRSGWSEEDTTCPIVNYGRQKVAVEWYMSALDEPWLIVRLPKLLSRRLHPRSTLASWVDSLGRETQILSPTDQFFAPAADADVARAIARLVRDGATGIWHLTSGVRISRSALLAEVVREYGQHAEVKASVVECKLADIPVLEPRPRDTSLNASKFQARYGACFRDAVTVATSWVLPIMWSRQQR